MNANLIRTQPLQLCESLYRALSPSGNPTLKTLMAVMKAVGLRISAVPDKSMRMFEKRC